MDQGDPTVALRLVDDDLELSLDLELSPESREALCIQLQRGLDSGTNVDFESRLLSSLTQILDEDLQPPTRSQVSYAMSIAKGLAISLPGEALRYKGSMAQFLARHAPIFKAQCQKQNP